MTIRKYLAGMLLLAGAVTQASAQPTPGEMLHPKLAPKFDDAAVPVPSDAELKGCTVKTFAGTAPKAAGYLMLDAKGQPLRRYFDSNGDGKVDMWSYYKDGVEVYREIDTAFKGLPNNFRWLNTGGMKWGVGGFDARTEKFTINRWLMISAEEAAYEAFQAAVTGKYERLEALFISDADMQAIKLPAAKAKAIAATQQGAAKKFADLVKSGKLTGARFDGVEGAVTQCDTANGDVEIIKYASRAVRYPTPDKKFAWLHTGEMIQVGMAWRLVDAPSDKDTGATEIPQPVAGNTKLDEMLKALAIHDESAKDLPHTEILGKNAKVDAYYRKRIEIVHQILPLEKEAEIEGWYKQIFDNMTAVAQNSGDAGAVDAITKLKDAVAANKKFSANLAAYGHYREMWTRFALQTAKETDSGKIAKLQDQWLDNLGDFVTRYPKSDDAPEALNQLAVGCEYAGKLEEAKNRYKQFAETFANHHHAPRAKGSLARLNLVGKKLELSGPLLSDQTKTFDIGQLKGKMVIVHYWATASTTHTTDFAALKQIMTQFGAKNEVALVCICLDDDIAKARAAVAQAQVPAVHLFQSSNNASGLNSPLATQYGIHILPSLFLVNREGVVTNNALQIGDIAASLK